MKNNKILILYAHPAPHRSEVNKPMVKAAAKVAGVTLIDLYYQYPNFDLDIDKEQQRLRDHDVIIFHFPFYWYSTPAILKEWQDLVLEYGFAYGREGRALHGKTFLCVITAGGREQAYHCDGLNHFTVRQLLTPLEQMANLCGMDYLPPFVLFNARNALEEKRLKNHITLYKQLLQALGENRFDLAAARQLTALTQPLDPLIRAKEHPDD